jgi:hypothetical protein
MVPTRGLSHIALSVKDPDRSLRFYGAVFRVREYPMILTLLSPRLRRRVAPWFPAASLRLGCLMLLSRTRTATRLKSGLNS